MKLQNTKFVKELNIKNKKCMFYTLYDQIIQ